MGWLSEGEGAFEDRNIAIQYINNYLSIIREHVNLTI